MKQIPKKEHMLTEFGKLSNPLADKLPHEAMWFGKCCTALLFVVLSIFLLFPRLPLGTVNSLILLCAAVMAATLLVYIPVFRNM